MSIRLPQRRQTEPSRLATLERSQRANSYERNLEKLKDLKHQHEYENLVEKKVKPPRRHDPLPAIPEKQPRKPRSKRNEIYESVPQQDEFKTITRRMPSNGRRHRRVAVILVLAFLLVSAELGFVFIIWKGVLDIPLKCAEGCSEPDKTAPPTSLLTAKEQRQTRSTLVDVQGRAARLKVAFEHVNNASEGLVRRYNNFTQRISKLEHAYAESLRHRSRLRPKNLPVGVPGPRGSAGEPGAPGVRGPTGDSDNTSTALCSYEQKTSTLFTANQFGSGQDVVVRETEGMQILGAACSTSGTTEYNLYSFVHQSTRFYKCWCKGRSHLFPKNGPAPGTSVCSIHYLACPTVK